MKKRLYVTATILAIIFGGLVVYNLFKQFMIKRYFANRGAPSVTISSTIAKSKSWQGLIPSIANMTAIQGIDVTAEASGIVDKIHFKSGQLIKKGESLIDLDDRVDQALLKDALAKLTLNKINFQRQSSLIARQATSKSKVDEARANLQEASSQVEKTKVLISQKKVTAPFTGKLGLRQVSLGDFISQGTSKIVTLQSQDPIYLRFFVPERYFKQLSLHQPIRFSLQAYPNRLFHGEIHAISSKVDPDTHNISVEAIAPNCPRHLDTAIKQKIVTKRHDSISNETVLFCDAQKNNHANVREYAFVPGMFAELNIFLPEADKVIVLPRTAIAYSLYGNSVFVIKNEQDKASNKTIKRAYQRFIKTGEERGGEVVILSGLKEGEEVVSSGQLKVHNGTPVTVNNEITLNPVRSSELKQ